LLDTFGLPKLKPCPHCNTTEGLKDCYVFVLCRKCLMQGPATNKGLNDDHADFVDHEKAIEMWNNLPRRKK
jgi:hypothetical protein